MLEFVPDHIVEYGNHTVTPMGSQKALPFCPTLFGEHFEGERYFVRRSGQSAYLRNSYLLIVTKEGAGYITHHGTTVRLSAGSAAVVACEPFQTYGTLPQQQWHFRYIHFTAATMEGYRHALLSRGTAVCLPDFERIWSLMAEMYALCDSGSPALYAQLSHAVSDILTAMVCADVQGDSEFDSGRADMLELASFIRENCAAELHIDDFCARANLSRHYLIRCFERHIGVTPYRYMHLCRINRAQTLLQDERLSAAQIADAVGYANAAIFTRHFKSFHGVTPAAYRRDMRSV